MLLPNAVMFSSGLLGIVFKLCLVSVYARKLKHIFSRKLMLLWQQADEIVHYCELLRMGTVYLLFRCPLDGSSVPADYNWILSPPSLSVTLISLPLLREWMISTNPAGLSTLPFLFIVMLAVYYINHTTSALSLYLGSCCTALHPSFSQCSRLIVQGLIMDGNLFRKCHMSHIYVGIIY